MSGTECFQRVGVMFTRHAIPARMLWFLPYQSSHPAVVNSTNATIIEHTAVSSAAAMKL